MNYVYKLKENRVFYIILAIILAVFIYSIIPYMIYRTEIFCQEDVASGEDSDLIIEIAESGAEVYQSFQPKFDNIKAIGIKFGTYGKMNKGKCKLILYDETLNEQIAEESIDLLYLTDNSVSKFVFQEPIKLNRSSIYTIKIFSVNDSKENQVAILGSSTDVSGLGKLIVFDQEKNGDIYFAQYGYNEGCNKKTVFFVLLLSVCVLFMLMVHESVVYVKFENITHLDVFFVIVAMLLCCICFNQGGDMKITIKHAIELLNTLKHGEALSFYRIVLENALEGNYVVASIGNAANYNFFLYLILAIVLLPFLFICHIAHIEYTDIDILTYYNFALVLVVLASAYLIFQIALQFSDDISIGTAKRIAYLYLTSIILMFGTVGFSQMDIFYIIFMLLALKQYMNKHYYRFALYMSVSIMLKTFPILMFVPLVLLIEKRITHILKFLIIGMSSSLVCKFIFCLDSAYEFTQKEMQLIYGFNNRLFQNGISGGMGICALFIFIFLVVCIFCFDRDVNDANLWKYMICVPLIIYSGLMVFVGWHPQWIVILTPFVACATGLTLKKRSVIYCEWGIGVTYLMISFLRYPQNADNYMINRGMLAQIMQHSYNGITLADIFNKIEILPPAISSVMVALIACFCYNSIKCIFSEDVCYINEHSVCNRWVVLARCATIYGVCVLFSFMYFYVG